MPSSIVLGNNDVSSQLADIEDSLTIVEGKVDDVDTTVNDVNDNVNANGDVADEITRHFHSDEYWFGARTVGADPNGSMADRLSMTPFEADCGNDQYGSWVQILGPDDTPVTPGYTDFDPHRITITDEETKEKLFRTQFYIGETPPMAFDSVLVTETIGRVKNADDNALPQSVREELYTVGQKMWCRVWIDGQDTKFVQFFLGVHEYP